MAKVRHWELQFPCAWSSGKISRRPWVSECRNNFSLSFSLYGAVSGPSLLSNTCVFPSSLYLRSPDVLCYTHCIFLLLLLLLLLSLSLLFNGFSIFSPTSFSWWGSQFIQRKGICSIMISRLVSLCLPSTAWFRGLSLFVSLLLDPVPSWFRGLVSLYFPLYPF